MKKIFVIAAIFVLSVARFGLAQANMDKTITLSVPGMTCAVCPITVKKALEKVPGVSDIKTDINTKTAVVIFDPNKTNITQLMNATAQAGYPSEELKSKGS